MKRKVEDFLVFVVVFIVLVSGPIMFVGGGVSYFFSINPAVTFKVFVVGSLMSVNTIVFYWAVYRAELRSVERIRAHRKSLQTGVML